MSVSLSMTLLATTLASSPYTARILLAVTAGFFDKVSLERMAHAEQAVRLAAAGIPGDVIERLGTAGRLSNIDRETIIDIAYRALVRFQPKPEPRLDSAAKVKA